MFSLMALNDNYTGIYLFRIFNQKIKWKIYLRFHFNATITDTKRVKIDKLRNQNSHPVEILWFKIFFIEFYIIITYQISWEKFNISQAWYDTILGIKFQINYIAILA